MLQFVVAIHATNHYLRHEAKPGLINGSSMALEGDHRRGLFP